MGSKPRAVEARGPLAEIVPDFLPPLEDLVVREDTVKITIALSRESVAFFKGEAREHHTQYQKMIRRLLDAYARAHRAASPHPRPGRHAVHEEP